jgi:DnaJ-class molecular chaperone
MVKSCKHCSGSGKYIAYGGPVEMTTAGFSKGGAIVVNCKYCNGTGQIDEEEIISVPRKYVKDEYFEQG